MAIGILFGYPKFVAFDSVGDPLSGGKLFSYESGTTTAKATYTTRDCTTANTNPVILDSRGEATVYFDIGAYKLILKDSDDNQIWTQDGIYGNAAVDNIITTLGDIIQGGTGGYPERLGVGATDYIPVVLATGKLGYRADVPVRMTNRSGGTLSANDVVVTDTSNDTSVTTTTVSGLIMPVFILSDSTCLNATPGAFQKSGIATVAVYGNVTRGNYLRTSSTAGKAEDAGSNVETNGVFAQALTSYSGGGSGTVTAYLFNHTLQSTMRWQSYGVNFGGTGADGASTVSTNTTLTVGTDGIKVLNYTDLTVDTGVYLESHADDKVLVILCSGTLTINGTIRMNGRGATGGAVASTFGYGGGAGCTGGGGGGGDLTYGGGGGGASGFTGGNGGTGTGGYGYPFAPYSYFRYGGFHTGKSGDGSHNSNGAAGLSSSVAWGTIVNPISFERVRTLFGGGGGGAGGTGSGAGGNGGGVVWIEAKNIVWGASGAVTALGDAGVTGASAKGGGGGGGGGWVQIGYRTKTGSSTITVTGGAGGLGPGAGTDGGAGGTGGYLEIQV